MRLPHSAAVVISNISQSGAFGVYLFFTLSAFLITGLLQREKESYGRLHVKAFYVRRALRIWPLYFFILLVGSIYSTYFPPFDRGTIPYFLLFAGNWIEALGRIPSFALAALWSISVEEQFYLLWPPIVARLTKPGIEIAAITMLLSPAFALPIGFALGLSGWHFAFMNSFSCVSAMGAGILLACRPRTYAPRIALLLVTGVCWYIAATLNIGSGAFTSVIGISLAVLGSACFLASVIGLKAPKTATALGKVSYGLYVYHAMAIAVVLTLLGKRAASPHWYPVLIPAAFILSVVMALGSYRWLETPFLRMKERFTFVGSRPV